MYSIDLVGSDLVIKNTKNPRVNNQFVVATIPQSSNDLTWAFTEDEKRVKLIANGVALTTTLFSEVKVSGVPCTSKADFISKMSVLSDFAGPVSAPSPYKVYTALLTQSGDAGESYLYGPSSLTIGVTYTIMLDPNTDCDFTNVGAPNNNIGTSFVATGTTPNSWGSDPGNTELQYFTGAPVVTVLENTIGNIWWTYSDVGKYIANSTNAFTNGGTWQLIENSGSGGSVISSVLYVNSNEIWVYSFDGGTQSDDILYNTPIEIRVYN